MPSALLQRTFLLLLSIFVFSLLPAASVHAQNVFTVDDSGDAGDNNPGDSTCATSSGDCTLRAAIEEANATANSGGADRIEFDISTSTYISPSSPLPEITDPIVIDGTTASSGSLSRLRIDGCSSCGNGLVISTGDSEVRGLQIIDFPEHGILLTDNGNNVIEDCQIGDFLSGGSPAGYGNGGDGIRIEGGSTQNRIGDTDTDARNIISGNGGNGISISGGDPGGTNNRIYGNYIGVAQDGLSDLGNDDHGVLLEDQTRFNIIGSSQSTAPGNVISGNAGDGVRIVGTPSDPATSDNLLASNRIGLDDDGDAAVPNDGDGVRIEFADDNRIGTTRAAANVISSNDGDGIDVTGQNNEIKGNYVGTNADGDASVSNGMNGIFLRTGSHLTTIGGTTSASANVISGNTFHGLRISGSDDVALQGNYIGTDRHGAAAVGNGGAGLRIDSGASGVIVGGTEDGAGNVISDNSRSGVVISDFNDNGTSGNEVLGNLIGTNADGDAALGNGASGVLIEEGASSNTVGGTSSGARNVISGNDDRGIRIEGSSTSDNLVEGNYVGTNAAGDAALGNDAGGVQISDALNNMIGGTSDSARNVISGNGQGIILTGADATGNTVYGNYIGTDASGNDPLGNELRGVLLTFSSSGGASGNTIGGTAAGEGNVIAYNGDVGVKVVGSPGSPYAADNSIRGNSIFRNDGIGIDLRGDTENSDGVTENDDGDADNDANRLQNFPEIQDSGYDDGADEVTVTYRVPSDPNESGDGASAYPLEIDFYQADDDEEEGQTWLGSDTYAESDYTGGPEKTVSFTPEAPITQADLIVATATDANGNTSEFSRQAQQLPVELVSFEAKQTEQGVTLSWQTASEQNNSGFAVERKSNEAEAWAELGFVAGAGTTSQAQRYRFTDEELPYEARAVTYRLKQVDTDGTAHYSKDVELEVGVPKAFALHGNFPNPASGTTTIRYELPEAETVRLVVYDLLGREVAVLIDKKQEAGRKALTFDASRLASGVYLYRVEAGSNTASRRMVVTQ